MTAAMTTGGAAAGAAIDSLINGSSSGSSCPSGGGNNTPGNNQAQNKQFRDAVKDVEKQIGRKLSDTEKQQLHREISGQGYGYHDIVDTGVGMFQ
jgi:membrane protein involved in colicin uptake